MTTTEISGDSVAVDTPQDDYVVHSETVKETPAPETKVETVDEPETEAQADDTEEQDTSSEAKPKRGGFQKKIEKLGNALSEKDARIAELEAKLNGTQPKTESVNAADGKPTPDNFDTYDAYIDALTDWKVENKSKAISEENQRKANQSQAETAMAQKVQSHKERTDEYAKSVTDYDTRVQDYIESGHVTGVVYSAIMDSDMSEKVTYYLATHPEEAMALSSKGIVEVNKAIGKIEARLEGQSPKVAAVKTTKAPPPVKPVGSIKANGPPDLDSADMDTFTRMREEQIRSRRF